MLPQPNKIIKILGSFCLTSNKDIFNLIIISRKQRNIVKEPPLIQVSNQKTNDYATLVWKPQPFTWA